MIGFWFCGKFIIPYLGWNFFFFGSHHFITYRIFVTFYKCRLTSVKENGTIRLKYTYDSMGRLIREDNAYANKTYVYTYTSNGNISAKKTYAYTTGTLGAVQTTETRAYGNSNWLDQLTNINATAITYDSMGNPLNWHNASAFTWEGRKLKSLTKMDGTVISYAYDENGIRTGKTAGSENVSYVLDGTKIVREIRSAYTLTFLYDDSGNIVCIQNGWFADRTVDTLYVD